MVGTVVVFLNASMGQLRISEIRSAARVAIAMMVICGLMLRGLGMVFLSTMKSPGRSCISWFRSTMLVFGSLFILYVLSG